MGNGVYVMNSFFRIVSAGMLAVLVGRRRRPPTSFSVHTSRAFPTRTTGQATAILDTAAQMVRQDRANFHKFHNTDPDDENDVWFRDDSRARLERMLGQGGAMNSGTSAPSSMANR